MKRMSVKIFWPDDFLANQIDLVQGRYAKKIMFIMHKVDTSPTETHKTEKDV